MSSSRPAESEAAETIELPLSLESCTWAIGSPTRWKLLAALADGESLMVTELAARVRKSPTAISKQMIHLRNLGVVEVTRRLCHLSGRLKRLGERKVDFGYFVACFGLKVEPKRPKR